MVYLDLVKERGDSLRRRARARASDEHLRCQRLARAPHSSEVKATTSAAGLACTDLFLAAESQLFALTDLLGFTECLELIAAVLFHLHLAPICAAAAYIGLVCDSVSE